MNESYNSLANCYKVFFGAEGSPTRRMCAIVRTEQAAINFVNLHIWYAQATDNQIPEMCYEKAFIEGVVF